MKISVRPVAELTNDQRAALHDLNAAVHRPEEAAARPGQSIEWAAPQSSVVVWDDAEKQAIAHAGIVIRQARWNRCNVMVGGIGNVMTHPDFRCRGYARNAVNQAMDFFRERDDVDFALLVCKPSLFPFYERFGWRVFPGELFVEQPREDYQVHIRSSDDLPTTADERTRWHYRSARSTVVGKRSDAQRDHASSD